MKLRVLLFALCTLRFALCASSAFAAPTLARLSFYVPPARMSEFETAYQERLVPILKRHDLVESSSRGRATPDSVFSRLFEVKTLLEVAEKQKMLDNDATWKEALQSLGMAFGTSGPDSLIQFGFDLYSAPAGPGRAVPAGPGKAVPAGRGTGHWHTYSVTDGLPEVIVWSVFQDRKGDLWFGTISGVSRYDGKTFTTFTTQDGLANNEVRSIFQDRKGDLWFGTQGGVSRYDGKTFTTFTTQDGLSNNVVISIFQNQKGHLCFGTEGGVSQYDGKTFTALIPKDRLSGSVVLSTFQDREGNLWFGTWGEGVSRYDGKTFTTLTTKDGLVNNEVWSIFQDQEGNLWFGTTGGVNRYDGETFTTFTTRDGLASDVVRTIFQDREGVLWFGTRGGVSRYDGKALSAGSESALSGMKRQPFTTFTTKDGLAGNEVWSILQDREGVLWFGTWGGGVSRYDGKTFTTFTTKDGLGYDVVFSIFQDREGVLWFGTWGGGVSRYDGKTFTTFTTKDGLASDVVRTIFQDREGVLWFGTGGGGVSRYDGKTFTTFTTRDGLIHNDVWSIFQDWEGHFWFGTHGGVSRYDGKTFTTFTTRDGLANDVVRTILQDREKHLWFGTRHGGVSRYDRDERQSRSGAGQSGESTEEGTPGVGTFTTFVTKDGLASNWVYSIFQDREGVLWFGTGGGGVSRYDREGRGSSGPSGRGTFTTFTTRDGLAGNIVVSISQDRKGHLWFATFGGVSQYDGQAFQTMLQRDGLGDDEVWCVLQDKYGDFWFGTTRGVTRYRPSEPSPPSVAIDAVVADRRYENTSDIAIPSSAGLMAFEFHAISFKTRPEQMVYRYRLKGYDGDWKNTHARRVEYHDLPRETYTFEVQAVDRDLVYSEKPATVALTVHLPYAQIGLVVALGIAIALIVYQAGRVVQRDRKLHKSNEDLRREMAERQRAEEERARLDTQIQSLRYLYRLRSALGAARSPEEVIQQAGDALMEVLSASTSGGVLLQYNGRTWEFGEPPLLSPRERGEAGSLPVHGEGWGGGGVPPSGGVRYERGLFWGERERGRLVLFCGVELSEAQERALLDETAGQIGRVLEARELEAQILQSARLVSLGQMAAGVAHEINQPLGAISATAEDYYLRIKDGLAVSQGQWQEMLRRILGMVGRMTDTVEHLRVFSRDTPQEPGIRLSVNQVIHSALSVIGTQLKNHGIRLRLDLAEDLPPVTGHPHQIEQVLLNLLGNARDALDEKTGYRESGTVNRPPLLSPRERGEDNSLPVHGEGRGGGRTTNHEPRGWEKGLWVRTQCETFGGDRWVVAEVEDNGVGIDEAHIGRVFEPFFTTKPTDRGTGLGLSISYAIVRNHGGQIACESRKGEGTTFRVMLPATEEI